MFVFVAVLAPSVAAPAQDMLNTPRLVLSRELVIDSERENLVNVGRVFIRSDGAMALVQAIDYRVVLFDSAGRRLGAYGQRGDGPGEFAARTFVSGGWVGDTLWILHGGLSQKLSLFGADFRSLEDRPFSEFVRGAVPARSFGLERLQFPTIMGAQTSSRFLVDVQVDPRRAVRSPGVPAGNYLMFADRSGNGVDFATYIPHPPARYSVGGTGGTASSGTFPLAANHYFTASSDAQRILWVVPHMTGVRAGNYSLVVRSATGATLVDRLHPFQWLPIPRSYSDSIYRAFYQRQQPQLQGALRALAPPVPAYEPILGVRLGLDYSIWLRLRSEDENEQRWLLFDPDGDPFGHLTVPATYVVRGGSLGRLWVTIPNADGLTSVHRFRLDRPR